VLMDQRGTGRSTPITKQTLQRKFPHLFALDDTVTSSSSEGSATTTSTTTTTLEDIEQDLQTWEKKPHLLQGEGDGEGDSEEPTNTDIRAALSAATEYITRFRADNIVLDAEAVKDCLLPVPEEDEVPTPHPWGCALGQSFGGFCLMTYLSQIPHPPKLCLFTGGIAPMLTPLDHAYARLRKKVKERNGLYYDRYPGDVALVKSIVRRLDDHNTNKREVVWLPSGGKLTARRFLQVGISLGSSPSSFASLHSLFQSAFASDDEDDVGELSRSFLKSMDSIQPFDDHPLYFLLHESIYADGGRYETSNNPSNWAADTVYDIDGGGDFDFTTSPQQQGGGNDDDGDPILLFGEVVFPWMAEGDYAELSGWGMRSLAHKLAQKDDWTPLYDADHMRTVLSSLPTTTTSSTSTSTTSTIGHSKAAAAVYYDDMYVDFHSAMEVTRRGDGPLEECKVWVTNEYQHSGLRDDGGRIFCKLFGMAKGTVGTPS